MKKLLLSFASVIMLAPLSAQWVQQTAPNGNNYYSVFVINNNDVGIAGTTGLLRTTNGGATWSQQVTIGGVNFFELHTKDPSRWYSLSQNSNWFIKMLNPSGSVLNGGKPDSILSLNFATTGCASAVGTAGKIETTCDTGATWQVRSSGTSANLNAVWFADQDTGCAVGNNGVIRRTTNGGSTWSAITSPSVFQLNGIHFPTPSVGYAVGNNGVIIKSTDAGKTWMAVPSGTNTNFNGVFFTDQDSGYVVGYYGTIMKTYNGGASWVQLNSTVSNILNSVHFSSPIDGWVVGNNGVILKYTGIYTGIKETDPLIRMELFPNPAHDLITVMSSVAGSTVRIRNSIGQILQQETLGGSPQATLNVSALPAGVYYVECTGGAGTSVKKFIRE